jgi:hypothetical protein
MEKWRVVIDGNVYTVPKSKVGSQREAEAAVRKFVGGSGKVTQTRTKRQPARPNDILTGLSQGATLGAGDEVFGRLESFLGNTPADDAIARRRADYDEARKRAPVMTMGAEFAGSLVPTLGALGATRGKAAGQLPMVKSALARASLIGAAEGGIAGFNTGEGDASQRAPGAAVGAALGGVLGGTGQIVAPKISDAGKTLMEAGMRLTPDMLGQPAQRTLNILQKVPSPFQARKDESLEAFNVVVANEVLKPAGKTIANKSGREAYAATADAISEAYNDLLDPIASMDLETSYTAALEAANASIGLSKKSLKNAMKQAKALDNLVTQGAVTGKQFKNADSKLRGMIESYRNQTKRADLVSDQQAGRDIADALEAVREDMFDRAAASIGGDFGERLRGVDYSYKLLQTLRRAVEYTGGDGETFSPAQLLMAVKAMNKQSDAFARSAAPLQELAEAGKNVFGAVPYNSAADNAVLSGLGLNQGILPMLGGLAAAGYDQRDDGQLGQLGASGLALGGLALLGQRPVYNRLAPAAVTIGNSRFGPGSIMQNAAPFLGMQSGRLFNEDQN